MSKRSTRLLAAAILVSVTGYMAAVGCGDQSTPDVAATVDEHNVTQPLVLGWARFGAGVRDALGLPPRSPEVLEAAAVASLIEAQWIRIEATSRDVVLNSDERPMAVAAFEQRLSLSKEQIQELRSEARLGMPAFEARAVAVALQEAIVARNARLDTPSRARLKDYYGRHIAELDEPERRSFGFLISDTKGGAMRGKLARERGESWKAVAQHYSHALALARLGWRIADKTQSEVRGIFGGEAANVAFNAPRHEVIGPSSLRGGWIVFEVTDIVSYGRPAFPVVREAIRNRLIDDRRLQMLASLRRKLKAKYAGLTRCAPRFSLNWCRVLRFESEPDL